MSHQHIEHKLSEVFELVKNNPQKKHSLISGGELVFLYKYAQYTKAPEAIACFERELEAFIPNIHGAYKNTFCDGLFGNIWLLEYLKKEGVIDDVLADDSEAINMFFLEIGNEFCEQKNYDFLHGLLGLIYAGLYCESVDKGTVNNFSERMLKNIRKSSDAYYFPSWVNLFKKEEEEQEALNFSLAHGMPSAISILARCNAKEIPAYVNGMVNCLLQHKNTGALCLFPSYTSMQHEKEKDVYSRLGWCYGDLGIACALFSAGNALGKEAFKKEAIDTLLHASKRRDLVENRLVDACVCHGTAGVAHIFNRFYKQTQLKELDDARMYWLEQTLKMAKFEDGLAGYKIWHGEKGFELNYGLLEGIAGIGLVLLGFLTEDINDLNWDACLLIS